MITARMRSGSTWSDVCIRNVSSRGILLNAVTPPQPGAYIEIRRGSVVIVARTVWSKAPFFGVRTQDRIDIKGLINEPRLSGRPPPPETADAVAERRANTRKTTAGAIAQRLERSRRLAAALEFGLLILAAVTIAGIAATHVYGLLAKPLAVVASKL